MSYRDTARAFTRAESTNRYRSAAHLPMSEWSESRRDTMTPATIAANHALYVEDAAADLREVLNSFDYDYQSTEKLAKAARRLLEAIGEA